MLGVFSDYVHCTPAAVESAVTYFKEVYSGEVPEQGPSLQNSYQLVSTKPRKFEMKSNTTSINSLDFSFADQTGAFQPLSGHVQLSVKD